MRNIVLFVVFISLLSIPCFSQTQFARAIGGANYDCAYSIIQTVDSGYAIVGHTKSYADTSDNHSFIIKLDKELEIEWSKVVSSVLYSYSIVQTMDSGFVICGTKLEYFFILKLNKLGDFEWEKQISGICSNIFPTNDAGFIAIGRTDDFGAGDNDIFVVKLNSRGSIEWAKTIGGSRSDVGQSVFQTSDGGFIITGFTSSFGDGGDIIVAKIDSIGLVEWTKIIGGTSSEQGNYVIQTIDNGFIITGYTWSFGTGGTDLFIIRLDSSGSLQWAKSVGGTRYDCGISLAKLNDSDFVSVGYVSGYGAGMNDLLILKFDLTGTIEWIRAAGGGENDLGRSITISSDGGIVVAGNTYSFGAGNSDIFLLKFDSNGNNCISTSIRPTVTNVTPVIRSVTPTVMNVAPYIRPESTTIINFTPNDTLICQSNNVSEKIIKPKETNITIIPNPFNSKCTIICPNVVKVMIYDLHGNIVFHKNNINEKEITWQPVESLPSGLYFVSATTSYGTNIYRSIIYLK